MGKAGTVLGLIGILLGAGGLVFGFIAWSSLQTQVGNGENIDTWYTIDNTTFTVSPAVTVLELVNNTISFELTSTASVYMSFTCSAVIFPSGIISSIFFFFKVDGEYLDNVLKTEVGSNNGGSTEDYFSVHLQHFIENMNAGSHNITVCVSSGTDVNKISDKMLFVQSFT